MNSSRTRLAMGLLAALAMAGGAGAAVRTTAAAGYWTNTATWVDGGTLGVPQAGDAVTIAHAVTLDVSTPVLGSFANNNATLTFSGWTTQLTATNVTINNTVTHLAQTATSTNASGQWVPDHRIWIVCTNLTINATRSVNANGKGYAGGTTKGTGCGPGGGGYADTLNAGGGGYGGAGGAYGTAPGGLPYGTSDAPEAPGSGGGGADTGVGASGGGAVRLEVSGHFVLNGSITAVGNNSGAWRSAPGAGGSIFVTCRTIAATNGLIEARGGSSMGNGTDITGSGGGGRVSLVYNTTAQSQLNALALPVLQIDASCGSAANWGRPGTVRLSDSSFYPAATIRGGRLVIPGFTAWAPSSLTVQEGLVEFEPGFQLTVANDVELRNLGGIEMSNGVFQVGGDFRADNRVRVWNTARSTLARSSFLSGPASVFAVQGDVSVNEGHLYLTATGSEVPEYAIGGSLIVTNDARVHVQAAPTNGVAPAYGALVTVGGTLLIRDRSWVYPMSAGTNGGSPRFQAMDVMLNSSDAGLDASARGFQAGVTGGHGRGPGRGMFATHYGGYGGKGGNGGTGEIGGGPYGSSNAPALPGSGGGGSNVGPGSSGGGLVELLAQRTVMVNGRINANGGNSTTHRGGNGSGGAIHIRCLTFAGTNMLISADGGQQVNTGTTSGGGGGGGRIAIWRMRDNTNGTVTVTATAPTNRVYQAGADGTVVWGAIPPRGTVISIR